ncbi:hypothetical protein [Pseudomonas sp. SWRI154]|uniref:hypothetical protein n=1 Tax=Pseudomonas sp. SWRI154 TaxID=2745501 RepID=UPI001EE16F89|nr:hypothetical protein [Pseudomonas sp. SWRI154]
MGTFTTLIRPVSSRVVQAHEPVDGCEDSANPLIQPQYRVVLAGKCFFHIEETSTGRVRGFRADHNEACHLARSLERNPAVPSAPCR